ncbi:uncharacterized protein EDB93DRAFT_1253670 [Suillus bovinus]|uniref:uncharacterized protein n=1 Tax=Suillus bovinus TaxID=48563 RepID=UPI001B86D157|nr:uncharacterized protein EDB93DRAFT_1253670 [Suillus bovinus]KAG2137420.1 hypothetical protein EDB93DRAFT_1253670 [Suillus bovinus]
MHHGWWADERSSEGIKAKLANYNAKGPLDDSATTVLRRLTRSEWNVVRQTNSIPYKDAVALTLYGDSQPVQQDEQDRDPGRGKPFRRLRRLRRHSDRCLPHEYVIPQRSPYPDPLLPHSDETGVPAPLDARLYLSWTDYDTSQDYQLRGRTSAPAPVEGCVLMEDIYTHVKRIDLRHSLAFVSLMQTVSLDGKDTVLSTEAVTGLKIPLQFTPALGRNHITTAVVQLYLPRLASDKECEKCAT